LERNESYCKENQAREELVFGQKNIKNIKFSPFFDGLIGNSLDQLFTGSSGKQTMNKLDYE